MLRKSWFLVAAALGVASPSVGASELTDFATKVKPSVVLLESLSSTGEVISSGTGFFISEDGLVVTNHHVIEDSEKLRATLSSGAEHAVEGLVADDKDHDLAIIKVEGHGYPALAMGSTNSLAEGERVIVVGSPRGLAETVSEGIVSAAHRELPKRFRNERSERLGPMVQITAPITHGSSGSPVMTTDGKVIGVAQSIFAGEGNIGFAVPAERLAELRARVHPGAKPRSFQPTPWLNWVISGVFYAALGLGLVFATRKKKRSSRAPRVIAR